MLKILIPLILFTLFTYSFYIEPQNIKIKEYNVEIKKLPQEFENKKIIFISDLHTGSPYNNLRSLEKIVNIINKQKPSAVLIGGDFEVTKVLFGRHIPTEDIAPILNKINGKKITVLGNHDFWNDKKRIKKDLEQNNITVLENENIDIATNKNPLFVAGLEDFMEGRPNINKALEGIGENQPIILLSHEPDTFKDIPKNVSLVLAGHTHGGQIRLPFIGPLYTASSLKSKYTDGFIKEDGKILYVTKGIGTSILPLRFLCAPEIVVFVLNKK